MNQDTHTLARGDSAELISSVKVEGTAVYSNKGDKLGTIHHLMIGKRDGKVRHAVVSYGGFLSIGEDFFPLPWAELSYDERRDGYVVDRDPDQLKNGPRYGRDQEPNWDRSYNDRLANYYTPL